MDISFHYYAIKVLSIGAGFDEADAQIISQYSQFVDDYNQFNAMRLTNVPEYASHLTVFGLFNPVTTGFQGIDNAWFTNDRYRRRILTPFHFIPEKQLLPGNAPPRVKAYCPETGADTLLHSMLEQARAKYRYAKGNAALKKEALMRIGMLLHIFADTYSHQEFSGGWGWENESKLVHVQIGEGHGVTREVTGDYHAGKFHQLPSIGHANVSTAPDETAVCFTMKHHEDEKNAKYTETYSRNNTLTFLEAARRIFEYLLTLSEQPALGGTITDFSKISVRLARAFSLYREKEESDQGYGRLLKEHWEKSTQGLYSFPVSFHYNKNDVLNCPLSAVSSPMQADTVGKAKTMTDDFYRYNVLAYEIRRAVTGESNPMNGLETDEVQLLRDLAGKV